MLFDNSITEEQLDTLTRWYSLRKQGRLFPLLQEGLVLWTFQPADPWGTKERISWEMLRSLVELEEKRKPIDSEHNNYSLRREA